MMLYWFCLGLLYGLCVQAGIDRQPIWSVFLVMAVILTLAGLLRRDRRNGC